MAKEGNQDAGAQEEKEEFSNDDFEKTSRFKEIVDQIRDSQIAANIVQSINYKDLQEKLLEILCIFLQKKEKNSADNNIISSALSLWSASLIENQQLIDEFYTWKRQSTEESNLILTADDLILAGVYSPKDFLVRIAFNQHLELICEKVT